MKIAIYIDDGRVFEYEVANESKGREHSYAIVTTGYRHSEGGDLEWYPAHRILKVKAEKAGESQYVDTVRAT